MFKRMYLWVVAVVGSWVSATVAFAGTDLDAVFAAIDLTTFSGKITTVLVAMIGIALLFLGYRMGKRAIR